METNAYLVRFATLGKALIVNLPAKIVAKKAVSHPARRGEFRGVGFIERRRRRTKMARRGLPRVRSGL